MNYDIQDDFQRHATRYGIILGSFFIYIAAARRYTRNAYTITIIIGDIKIEGATISLHLNVAAPSTIPLSFWASKRANVQASRLARVGRFAFESQPLAQGDRKLAS